MTPVEDSPEPAASAILFRGREVLLVERGGGPGAGLWSLPGGRIEAGETAAAAARREVREETGLDAELTGQIAMHLISAADPMAGGGPGFAIAVFYGHAREGTPRAASDARRAGFFPLEIIDTMALTEAAAPLIRRAHQLLSGEG